MPFHGHIIGIPDPADTKKSVSGTLREWSVKERDFTAIDQRIGLVDVGGKIYRVIICFPALIDKLYVAAGSTVAADDFILKWIADGESIPYGRAYFRLEPDDA